MDLPRLMFIDEECGNLKVVVESFQEIITERRVQKFYQLIDVANAINEIDLSIIFLAVTVS